MENRISDDLDPSLFDESDREIDNQSDNEES